METFETTLVDCILATNRVIGNMRVTDWSTCDEQWPHLKGITLHQLGSRPNVDLLIWSGYIIHSKMLEVHFFNGCCSKAQPSGYNLFQGFL